MFCFDDDQKTFSDRDEIITFWGACLGCSRCQRPFAWNIHTVSTIRGRANSAIPLKKNIQPAQRTTVSETHAIFLVKPVKWCIYNGAMHPTTNAKKIISPRQLKKTSACCDHSHNVPPIAIALLIIMPLIHQCLGGAPVTTSSPFFIRGGEGAICTIRRVHSSPQNPDMMTIQHLLRSSNNPGKNH